MALFLQESSHCPLELAVCLVIRTRGFTSCNVVTPLLTTSVLLREGAFWLGALVPASRALAVNRREISFSALSECGARLAGAFVAASAKGLWAGWIAVLTPLRFVCPGFRLPQVRSRL